MPQAISWKSLLKQKNPGALEPLVQALRVLLGPKGFIRRDRLQRALFISDAARHHGDKKDLDQRLQESGFTVREENGLLFIDLCPEACLRFALSLKKRLPDAETASLCRLYLEHKAGNAAPEPSLYREALSCFDAGDARGLFRIASISLARALRLHTAPDVFYLCLMQALPKEEIAP